MGILTRRCQGQVTTLQDTLGTREMQIKNTVRGPHMIRVAKMNKMLAAPR